jgi:hypothetical protein
MARQRNERRLYVVASLAALGVSGAALARA